MFATGTLGFKEFSDKAVKTLGNISEFWKICINLKILFWGLY